MCGRYTLYETGDLGKRFQLDHQKQFKSKDNYNVAPQQWLPVIFDDEEMGRIAEPMQWGYIPMWSKDPTKGPRPINTKAETAFESRMWIGSMRHHRCLVPARGFYEWKHVNERMKVPYFIHPKDQALFSFAGIYSIWNDVEGRPLYSFSILTTRPNREMIEVHDRMPVILHPGQEATWLNRHIDEREVIEPFLKPYKDGGLELYRVSDEVNSTRNNDSHLVQAIHN